MLTLLYLILILGLLIFVHEFGHFIAAKSIGVYVSEFALGNLFHKKLDFIPFDMLRKRFQKILLDLLEKDIGKSNFRYIKNLIYSKYNNGFYVRAKKNEFPNSKKAISYILRYCGRPCFASYRIIDIDKNEDIADKKHITSIPVVEFYNDNEDTPKVTYTGLLTQDKIKEIIKDLIWHKILLTKYLEII